MLKFWHSDRHKQHIFIKDHPMHIPTKLLSNGFVVSDKNNLEMFPPYGPMYL